MVEIKTENQPETPISNATNISNGQELIFDGKFETVTDGQVAS